MYSATGSVATFVALLACRFVFCVMRFLPIRSQWMREMSLRYYMPVSLLSPKLNQLCHVDGLRAFERGRKISRFGFVITPGSV